LDEEPVGTTLDLDARPEPEVETVDPGRLAALEASVFDVGQNSPLAVRPVQEQRSLDEQERARGSRTVAHVDPRVVRLGPPRIVGRIIDAVDLPRLGRARGRGEREVGVATGL